MQRDIDNARTTLYECDSQWSFVFGLAFSVSPFHRPTEYT